MKQGEEDCPILFKKENEPVLLAICCYVNDKIDEEVNPLSMAFTVEVLEKLFTKGKKREKKISNPYGRAGKPKEEL